MTRVRVGATTFFGTKAEASIGGAPSGFVIEQDGFTGWDDGTDIRRTTTDRVQAHGQFDTPGFQSGRVVSVSGLCYASSPGEMRSRKAELGGLLADGGLGQIIVDQVDGTTWGYGRLTGKTQFTPLLPGQISNYQIQFWFPNPRKFGQSQTFGGTGTIVTAYHYGNFAAAPVLTVAGSLPSGYTITGPTGAYTVTAAVVTGHPHVIDMATGYLTIDGVIQVGAVTVANLWTIAPGTTVTQTLTPVSGTATLAVTVTDTSI